MEENEQRDFDMRLNARADQARPAPGVEQLWGLMGRPGVAPGVAPGAVAQARPRTAAKVGEK